MPDLETLSAKDYAIALATGEALTALRTESGIPLAPGRWAVELRPVPGDPDAWEAFLADWHSGAELGVVLGQLRMSDIRKRAAQLTAGLN